MGQYQPALIMFMVTFIVTTLLFVPATRISFKSDLTNFYWRGFWTLLAIISSLAGGMNTLMLMRVEAQAFSEAVLAGVMAAYVLFVMFAWFRLVGVAAFSFLKPRIAALTAS